jgi:hypothetical protein
LLNDSTVVDTVYQVNLPANNTTYYCRVRAMGAWAWGSYSNPVEFVSVIVIGGQATIPVAVREGWNIISLPLLRDTATISVVLPNATACMAYQPGIGYQPCDTLATGRGYSVKFPSAEVILVTGTAFSRDTVTVSGGWNLIGAASIPVPATGVTTVPAGLIRSPFYSFSGSYHTADTLFPGRGYWAKFNGPGQLIIGPGNSGGAE